MYMAWAIRAGGAAERQGVFLICLIVVICPGLSSGGVRLHETTLSGVGCTGSIQTCFGQSQSSHPFTLARVGRAAIPSYMDVLDWPQVLLEAVRNACVLVHFCHPIKQAASACGLEFNKLKPPHKKKHSFTWWKYWGMQISCQNIY